MSDILDRITVLETKGFSKMEAIEILKLEQMELNNELLDKIYIQAPNGKRYLQVMVG